MATHRVPGMARGSARWVGNLSYGGTPEIHWVHGVVVASCAHCIACVQDQWIGSVRCLGCV